MYRDISIYMEVARRAKIVCADQTATIGNFASVDQWAASRSTNRRRMTEGYADMEERKRHLKEVVPSLNEKQLAYMAHSHSLSDQMDQQAELCAPHYTTTCLFKNVGQRFNDY
uniref:Uncharacterized protein n=1 Tax=Cyclophora tenuis TaxID=216820 RepID=A0A7S1GP00_CYCTE